MLARRANRSITYLLLLTTILQSGCGLPFRLPPGRHDTQRSYHDSVGLKIEYPQVSAVTQKGSPAFGATSTLQPHALEDPSQLPTQDLTLEEAIAQAVQNSPVVRSLGGTLISTPQFTFTAYDPALAHSNPLFGVEAALAAFDAQYRGQLFWTKVDLPNNVEGFGQEFFRAVLQETNASYVNEISKQTAQGGSFAVRQIVNYNRSNRPFRQFASEFNGFLEAEWRQPLMQGAGTEFNRIAGPNSPVGQYNGVLIARINEDISLADFEAGVTSMVADVENAYWNLYQAYRLLETVLRGRESALQTFQYQQVRVKAGAGRRDEEAQAQSQFFQFQAQVQNALAGPTGLYAAEQQLRYLIGMAATDGQLLKPVSPPTDMRIVFDWDSALGQALTRRVEIRRQKWNIQRRELELVAARLNRRPRLDFLGQYRWRGLGDNLIGPELGGIDNLYGSILGGQFQEWQAGMELSFPVGLRTASAAVAHAKLNVARERSLLNETELRISHDLSSAAREVERAFTLLETNYQRWQADLEQVEILQRRYRDGTDNINFFLQAQRQVVLSEADFYRALTEYNLAIRDLHFQKGTLLAYNQVLLSEAAWAPKAYRDAYERGRFFKPRVKPQQVDTPRSISVGEFNPAEPQATQGDSRFAETTAAE